MFFTWDEEKDEENYKKHNLHLIIGSYVFNDQERIERFDKSANNNSLENRWQTIGKTANSILFVAYEERDNQEYHLISVRLATGKERRYYYGKENDDTYPYEPAN